MNHRLPRMLAVSVIVLASAAPHHHRSRQAHLEVQTKMTDTIPEPAPQIARSRSRSATLPTGGRHHRRGDRGPIAERGYRIVQRPEDARYPLQANVLQVGVVSPTAAEQTFAGARAP
jgi:hypothetical protein